MATQAKGKANEEQGFNDAELEDIMNEIENLEKEFSDAEPAPKKKVIDPIEEEMMASTRHQPIAQDDSVEELEEVAEEAEVVNIRPSLPKTTKPPVQAPVTPKKVSAPSTKNAPTCMNFSVSGEMNMELNFEVGEHNVQLTIDPAEGLIINMGGGAKFCLPLSGNTKANRKTGT
jgi:hypothetical protein